MPTSKQYADALSSPSWTDRALPMEGRAAFLPFQDTLPGSVMNKRSLAIPGVFAGAINAITAPGRAYRGSDPTFNPQEEALNIGLNMMGGGMVASKVAPPPVGSLGIFAGSRAKTANMEALKVANEMKASGVPDESIYAKTGWFFGSADNKPRFEIPDDLAKISDDVYNGIKTDKEFQGPINQGLTHDKLYEAYPELGDIEASFYASKEPGGTYSAPTDTMTIGGFSTGLQRSVALHELQHAIQQREGFARGGSPERTPVFDYSSPQGMVLRTQQKAIEEQMAQTPYWDNAINDVNPAFEVLQDKSYQLDKQAESAAAMEGYRRLAGEAEARLTQSRKNMTAPERAASYPPNMFDVPVKKQIVRYGDDVARQKERK